MTIPVDLIILAVRAGVRLYSGLREAYATSIKEAAITLPLPRVPGAGGVEPDFGGIASFVTNQHGPADPSLHADFQREKAEILPIVAAFNAGHWGMNPPPDKALPVRAFYVRWVQILDPSPSGDPNDANTASAILIALSIRQWTRGVPGVPVAWQIALGTVIDVAVLWFANDPGAISTNRPEGKALKAFLGALQDVDFAHATKTKIVTDTLVAILNTVAANPGLISSGDRESALVKATTTSLAGAIKNIPPEILDQLDTNQSETLSTVLQSLAAATLRAGALTVLENPALFYVDTPTGPRTKVVEQVGKVFVDLILPTKLGGQFKIDVAGAVSAQGFETLVRAALEAAGNTPEILDFQGDGENRLTPLLAAIATAFSKAALPSSIRAGFAETAAIVITATASNIDTLWPSQSLDPTENLARGAVVAAVDVVGTVAAGTEGIAAFTHKDIVRLIDAAVSSVVMNPKLMDALPGENPHLKTALKSMLEALSSQSVAKLTAADAVVIASAGLKAAVLKQPTLNEIKPGSIVLKAILEAVFGALSEVKANGSDAAKWRVTGATLLVGIVEVAFDVLATLPDARSITPERLDAIEQALVKAISKGLTLEEMRSAILQVINA